MKLTKMKFTVILFVFFLIIVGCSDNENTIETEEKDTSKTDEPSELHIAHNAAPPTLDWHATGATSTRDITMLIYETLISVDADFQPQPMLAESFDISDDGKTYTFNLREGVKFHNGKEMTAEDVIASMENWLERSDITGQIFDGATWEANGDYTVHLKLAQPSSLTLDTIGTTKQAPAIVPKEVIESASAEGIDEYIGTGPYKFNEWKQDQYIQLVKNDDYEPLDEETSGWSGKKEALIDELYFHFVSDTSTRIAGLQTGEYDFGYDIPFDMYEQLEADPNINTFLASPANAVIKFNTKQGLASDFNLRQAINTALDYEEIMLAAFPHEEAFELTPGYMDSDIVKWSSDSGKAFYNINDQEKAKKILKDTGYDGENLRILTTRDYDYIYNLSVVVNEQLNNLGINSELVVLDWATVVDMTSKEEHLDDWNITLSGSSIVSTPTQLISLSNSWSGGVNDEHITNTMAAIELEADEDKAVELWNEIQQYAWEEALPTIQLGKFQKLYAVNKKVSDIDTLVGPNFWNITIND